MRILKLSVQWSAGCLAVLVVPFLLFSVCGVQVPHTAVILARCAVYLIPLVIVLLLVYCSAVGFGNFLHGLRTQSWGALVGAVVFLVVVGFIVASLIRVLLK
jgi:hypothetical protein